MSAGRRRRVAAATGRGRGGRIARGACCGSVPVAVPIAVVRQSKRRRDEESGESEDADRECEERVMDATGTRRTCRTSACRLPPTAPHSNPAAKAPHLPLSPEKASVDLVARSYSSTLGHSIGPRCDNTNETPGCSLVTKRRELERKFGVRRQATPRTRTKRPRSLATATDEHTTSQRENDVSAEGLRASEQVFESLRRAMQRRRLSPRARKAAIHQQGDACSPVFRSCPSRRRQRVSRRDLERLSVRSPSSRGTYAPLAESLRTTNPLRRPAPATAATSGVPLFDRRHAW